jgi:hypothetical protein
MAFYTSYGQSLVDDNNVLVYSWSVNCLSERDSGNKIVPNRKLTMPRIPEMAETRRLPRSFSSLIRRSPDGRSTTRVGAEGDEGEEKA